MIPVPGPRSHHQLRVGASLPGVSGRRAVEGGERGKAWPFSAAVLGVALRTVSPRRLAMPPGEEEGAVVDGCSKSGLVKGMGGIRGRPRKGTTPREGCEHVPRTSREGIAEGFLWGRLRFVSCRAFARRLAGEEWLVRRTLQQRSPRSSRPTAIWNPRSRPRGFFKFG